MTNRRIRLLCVAALLLTSAAASAQAPSPLAVLQPQPVAKSAFPGDTLGARAQGDWELPLQIVEQWGQGGPRFVTGGVPLLIGQAKGPAELALAVKDAAGKLTAVPAQFRVLARWWRADNSIRWVLADFQTNVGEFATRTFVLTNKKLPAANPKAKLDVKQTDDAITVTTGPARFVIGRKKFNLLSAVYIDDNKDGEFADDENLLADGEGIVLTDTLGNRYLGTAGTTRVEVLEAGPLRVRVRARGVNRDPAGKGYSKGMYQYDVFLDFYAGSTDVKTDLVLANNFEKSIGSPTFEDASVWLKLAGGASGYRLYGEAPIDGRLAGKASVLLNQDSNGADTWRVAQGHYGPPTSTFRGYKVEFRPNGDNAHVEVERPGAFEVWHVRPAEKPTPGEITQGGQARGLAHLYNDRGGVIVHTEKFWEQFPKAVELFGDGRVRLALFPGEYKVPHFFEDASGKGHVVVLHFYTRKMAKPYAADGDGRTWPHVVADCWDYPVFPRPSLEHLAAVGALTDLGPFTEPVRGFEDWPMEIHYRRMFMTDRYWGNGFGWQVFGSRWQAHGGHSSRGARQPIKEDAWLYKAYITGDRGWWVYGENRSRQFRDVRCYRIEGQDPFGFASWQEFASHNRCEDYTHRAQPGDAEYKKFADGLWSRSTWWLPNPAHQTLDLLYDRYLLFGDQRSLENMRIVAAHGGYFVGYGRPFIHRQTGWSLRALERYWELTGDQGAERVLKATLENYKPLLKAAPSLPMSDATTVNWWFTQVFSRGVAMTALHTADPQALATAKWLVSAVPDNQASYFCMLYAVLYHLTGEQKYKDAVLRRSNGGDALLTVNTSGEFPATAHWLVNQPPKKQ